MTRYYFAGAYQRKAELLAYGERLAAAVRGTVITSRWLTMAQEGVDNAAGLSVDGLIEPGQVARGWTYAQRDLEDISISPVIVSFTGEGARGGRHVEFGLGVAALLYFPWITLSSETGRLRLVIVGPREHVFHCLPSVEVYPDFEAFLTHETETQG